MGDEFISKIQDKYSNITFELDNIYFYPITENINLYVNDNMNTILYKHQINQYIHDNNAHAINPEKIFKCLDY